MRSLAALTIETFQHVLEKILPLSTTRGQFDAYYRASLLICSCFRRLLAEEQYSLSNQKLGTAAGRCDSHRHTSKA